MCLGNGIGADLLNLSPQEFFADNPGAVVFEARSIETAQKLGGVIIGRTGGGAISLNGEQLTLSEAAQAGLSVLESIYPVYGEGVDAGAVSRPSGITPSARRGIKRRGPEWSSRFSRAPTANTTARALSPARADSLRYWLYATALPRI